MSIFVEIVSLLAEGVKGTVGGMSSAHRDSIAVVPVHFRDEQAHPSHRQPHLSYRCQS